MKFAAKSLIWAIFLSPLLSMVQAADPVPYDSIANPLSKLPQTDTSVQRRGDLLNIKPSRVRVNQAGYRMADVLSGFGKFYYVGSGQTTFKLIDDSGRTVAGVTGPLTSKGATVSGQIVADASNSAEHMTGGNGDWKPGYPMTGPVVSGTLWQGVLPATTPYGRFRVVVGSDTSAPFIVSDNVYGMARDAALKFFGVARSGPYQSWFHLSSHLWDGWLVDSAAKNPDGGYKYKGALVGGWYDCGNHLKEAVTNAYPLAALGMMAATNPEKDADNYGFNQAQTKMARHNDGVPDVLKEAWVGAQFVLRSFRLANGVVGSMYLSVGDPTKQLDFQWWGRPENQDNVLSVNRGGRRERAVLRNAGSESISNFAAGMAYLSRLYKPYDPVFADTALIIAKAMYEYAKTANKKESATDYGSGGSMTQATLAHAAIALLWATRDPRYLNEAAYKPGMPDGRGGICADPVMATAPFVRFNGGFFGCGTNSMVKQWATDYQNTNSFSLYALIKLILVTPDTAANYGIGLAQRDTLLLRSMNSLLGSNMAGGGGKSVALPVGYGYPYNNLQIGYDTTWYNETVGGSGWYNKYQFGNLADLYMYYDAAGVVEGKPLLGVSGGANWKRREVLEVLLGGLGYMMGVNALDLSYIYGIGPKNPNHPHHRAANPEGKNVPGAYYNYAIPVGGLYGGMAPANVMKLVEYFDQPVSQTEANCPDASAVQIIPLMGLARPEPVVPPHPVINVLSTGTTTATIQILLDKWGYIRLGYGLDSSIVSQTTFVNGNDTSTEIRVNLTGLTPATQYYFNVLAKDLQLDSLLVAKRPNGNSDSIPLSFMTKSTPPQPPIYGNIKVCNVTSDSAEVMWVTPNGQYYSSVQFADSAKWKAAVYTTVDTDVAGDMPVTFHHVKLYGLKAKTTYYFKVGTPGSYDPLVGCFRTPNEDVKFDIRTSGYVWGGMRALTIGITNQDVKDYDSLELRLYVTGTAANVWDLGARCDIGIKYRTDGFQDAGFAFVVDQNLRKSHPKKIDSTCLDSQVCQWYFDVPIWGDTMQSQARMRLDLVWDKHKVEMSQPPNPVPVLWDDLMNQPPSHDIFDTSNHDWSFRKHVAGSDNGLSPVSYGGVPFTNDASSKEIMDQAPQTVEINPYIAVYRRNDFVYGFSPFAGEMAKKRVVFAMNMNFNAPYDVSEGSTIQIGNGTSTRLTGSADVYDQLTPASKGYITAIWLNGVPMTTAARRAALTRQADGTWKFDIPLKFTLGTNKLDVTFFASSDSLDTAATTSTCTESKGCAFHNAEWFVNYSTNLTPSQIGVFDQQTNPVELVTPDSSTVLVRVNDGNANLSKTAVDSVRVSLKDLRTGATGTVVLFETGVSTGVFQTTALLSVVSAAPALAGQISVPFGDSVVVKYVDGGDATDSSTAILYSKPTWPSLESGAVVGGCGYNAASAKLDRSLFKSSIGPELVSDGGFENPQDSVLASYSSFTGTLPGGWAVTNTDIVSTYLFGAQFLPPEGNQALDLNGSNAGTATQTLRSTAGTTVRVSFRYHPNPSPQTTSPALRAANLTWNGAVVAPITWDMSVDPSVAWKSFSIDLPAAGNDRLGFASTIPGNGGIMIDAVSARVVSASAGSRDSILSGRLVVMSSTGDSVIARNLTSAEILVGASGRDLSVALGALPDLVTGGRLDLVIRTSTGLVTATSVPLVDSVGPWIDSAKIVENLTGALTDSVYVWTSEPLAASQAWPFLVTRAGVALPAATFANAAIGLADPASNKYLLVLPAGKLAGGDSLRLDPATQSDASGIAALDCPTATRRLGLIARSAPIHRIWLVDSDGDSRADQVHIVFGKVVGARDLPESVQVWFGTPDTSRTVALSIAQATDSFLVATLPVPFSFGLTQGASNDGSGAMVAWKGGNASGAYSVVDSVGPALLSAAVRYGTSWDTLELRFSEPVKRGVGTGWLQAKPGTEVGSTLGPDSVISTYWRLPIVPGSVNPGDSVRPVATEKWSEARTGRKVAVNHPWIRVSGLDRPPAGLWISDADGDGRADQVSIVYHKTVGARDVPDSVQVKFGRSDSVRTVAVASATTSDSTIRFQLAVPYSFGITRGSAPAGYGYATFWKNGVSTGPFILADSVGPVLLSAAIRYGSATDTLDLQFSEPVAPTAGTGWLVAKPGTEVGTPVAPTTVSDVRWLLPVVSGSVAPGDSVRPLATEQWGEATTGRKPSIAHPWIPVGGSERAPAYGYFRDSDGDGAADQAVIVFQKAPRTRPGMALLWPSFGGFDTAVVDSGSWTVDATGTLATIAVGPFSKGVTTSATTDLGRWHSNGVFSFPMFDSVPPVLIAATIRYASADGVPDTLRIRWSEPVVLPALTVAVRHKPGGVETPVLTLGAQAVVNDPDGLGAGFLLDPDTVQFRKGDSAAFAATVVTDKFSNQVPLATRWVPVTFGTRPIRVDFRIQSYMELPVSGSPHGDLPAQYWIRGRGDQVWMRPDSTEAPDTTGYVGVTITINRPMGGAAYIYDNSGVYVTSIDFTKIVEMAALDKLPVDGAGMYQIRIVWDGRLEEGGMASSGVYVMRLLMKDHSQGDNAPPTMVNKVFKLGFKRPKK